MCISRKRDRPSAWLIFYGMCVMTKTTRVMFIEYSCMISCKACLPPQCHLLEDTSTKSQKYVCVETADSIMLCLTKSQPLFFQCFSVQSAVLSSKIKGRSKFHGDALLSYICKEVGVHVSLATTREHGDDHLAPVLLSRSDLKKHSKDHCMNLQAGN